MPATILENSNTVASEPAERTLADGIAGQSHGRTIIDGVQILVPPPVDLSRFPEYVGPNEHVDNILACWLTVDGRRPLTPVLVGKPGVGKNLLAVEAARRLGADLYILLCTRDMEAQDLAATARITETGEIEYVASALAAALISPCPAVVLLDEIAHLPHRSATLLASVLDERETLTSTLAGVQFKRQSHTTILAAMNGDDAFLRQLPGFLGDRLRPRFHIEYPAIDTVMGVVASNTACDDQLTTALRDWVSVQPCVPPRVAIAIAAYAQRLKTMWHRNNVLAPEQAIELIEIAALVNADSSN